MSALRCRPSAAGEAPGCRRRVVAGKLLLHRDAAVAGLPHPLRQGRDAPRRFAEPDAAGVDVGEQVALGVGVPGPRPVRQVRREALGCRQPRPFADQQHDHLRIEQFSDVVEDADAAVAHEEGPAETPAAALRLLLEQGQQPPHLRRHRRGRQPVPDGDLEIRRAGADRCHLAPGLLA
jgi:hypothetical protein